jgi:hypothetical protein
MLDAREKRTRVLIVVVAVMVLAAWAFAKMLQSTMK